MSTLVHYPKALAEIGMSRTAGYAQAGDTVTAPISVGGKSMMPSAEADAQRLARVAGFTKDELRELVVKLTAARQALASDEQIAEILHSLQSKRLTAGTKLESDKQARSAAGRKLVAYRRQAEPA